MPRRQAAVQRAEEVEAIRSSQPLSTLCSDEALRSSSSLGAGKVAETLFQWNAEYWTSNISTSTCGLGHLAGFLPQLFISIDNDPPTAVALCKLSCGFPHSQSKCWVPYELL